LKPSKQKPSRAEKRWRKKTFQEAVNKELREHKSSFLVFSILRLLVVVTMVRQLFLHSYESFFLCALTLILLYVPSWVQVKLRIELPPALEITVLCFIFAAEILGEINAFYIVIPFWDTILHTLNGFLAAAVGFSLVIILNDNDHLVFSLSPFFMALTAFCFSMTIGVLWEFFECFMDQFFHTDMQKDTVVHSIYSVALDATRSNKVVGLTGIHLRFCQRQKSGAGRLSGHWSAGHHEGSLRQLRGCGGVLRHRLFLRQEQGAEKNGGAGFCPQPKGSRPGLPDPNPG
jgi:hypothetical protein